MPASFRFATPLILLAALAGCRGTPEKRSSVAFHVNAVRVGIEGVIKAIPSHDRGRISVACHNLSLALCSLPDRIDKKVPDKAEQRKAAATQAIDFYAALLPELRSMKYDDAKMIAKMKELARIVQAAADPA